MWRKVVRRLLPLKGPRKALNRIQQSPCHSDDELLLLKPLSLHWIRLRKVWLPFRCL